jgi:hypothetical protein
MNISQRSLEDECKSSDARCAANGQRPHFLGFFFSPLQIGFVRSAPCSLTTVLSSRKPINAVTQFRRAYCSAAERVRVIYRPVKVSRYLSLPPLYRHRYMLFGSNLLCLYCKLVGLGASKHIHNKRLSYFPTCSLEVSVIQSDFLRKHSIRYYVCYSACWPTISRQATCCGWRPNFSSGSVLSVPPCSPMVSRLPIRYYRQAGCLLQLQRACEGHSRGSCAGVSLPVAALKPNRFQSIAFM